MRTSSRDLAIAAASAALALLLSAVALSVAFAKLLPHVDARFERNGTAAPREALTIRGSDFRPRISGGGLYERSSVVVTGLRNGEAILEVPIRFNATDYQFAHFDASGLNPALRVFLFWQIEERPDGVFYAEAPLGPDGSGWLNLQQEKGAWQGTIKKIEIGIFGDIRDSRYTLRSLTFHRYGFMPMVKTVLTEWLHFETWTHSSINAIRGAPQTAIVFPGIAVSAITLFAFILLRLAKPLPLLSKPGAGTGRYDSAVVLVVGAPWLALAILWAQQMTLQNAETRHLFAGRSVEEKKLRDWDGSTYSLASEIKNAAAGAGPKISFVVPPTEANLVNTIYRLRYHLLPELRTESILWVRQDGLQIALDDRGLIFIASKSKTTQHAIASELQRLSDTPLRQLHASAMGILIARTAAGAPVATPSTDEPVIEPRP